MANEVELRLDALPLVMICERCRARTPFVHQDRVLGHHVLLYILGGGIEVCEAGTRYDVRPGEALLLRAGVHHWGERPCAPDTQWIYAHFTAQDGGASGPDMGRVRNQEFEPADYARSIRLPKLIRLPEGGLAVGNLERMARLFSSNQPLRAAQMCALLLEALLDMYALAHPEPLSLSDPVSMAIALLERRLDAAFDAEALARECGLSYKYLAARFKAHTGLSPQAYHTRLRVSEAARLLRESGLNVTEISDRLGYCNPQYFSRTFAAVRGQSPSEYRRGLMRG